MDAEQGARLARRVLIPVTAALWTAAVLLAATFVSWWLCLLLLLAVLASLPLAVRARRRSLRLHTVADGGPDAAEAGWAELLDTSTDLGEPLPPEASVRSIAARLADAHQLDADARQRLRLVVAAVEHTWYGPADEPATPGLSGAVLDVAAAMRASAKTGLTGRYWPRSVLGTLAPNTPVEHVAGSTKNTPPRSRRGASVEPGRG